VLRISRSLQDNDAAVSWRVLVQCIFLQCLVNMCVRVCLMATFPSAGNNIHTGTSLQHALGISVIG
jgi:hypothetical protein